MNFVPPKYQNVVNPWQSPKEIDLAILFIERMIKGVDALHVRELLGLDRPARDWR